MPTTITPTQNIRFETPNTTADAVYHVVDRSDERLRAPSAKDPSGLQVGFQQRRPSVRVPLAIRLRRKRDGTMTNGHHQS